MPRCGEYYDRCQEKHNAVAGYIRMAEILFEIPPFVPKDIPGNWVELLSGWLQGNKISDISPDSSSPTLDFVEDAFVYRLPWGMEAIRVRAQANQDRVGDFSIDDFELSLAVPALESGTLNVAASVLMQSGFSSRVAAISAVESTGAAFVDSAGLRAWLAFHEVRLLFDAGEWPTPETAPCGWILRARSRGPPTVFGESRNMSETPYGTMMPMWTRRPT